MDQARFTELERKRDAEGLTSDEANELGRMMAEQEGKAYSNAEDREHPDALPDAIPEGHTGNVSPEDTPDREMRDAVDEDRSAASPAGETDDSS